MSYFIYIVLKLRTTRNFHKVVICIYLVFLLSLMVSILNKSINISDISNPMPSSSVLSRAGVISSRHKYIYICFFFVKLTYYTYKTPELRNKYLQNLQKFGLSRASNLQHQAHKVLSHLVFKLTTLGTVESGVAAI